MFRCVLLYGTTFSRTVEHLELGVDNLFDQLVRFCGEHRSFRILFKHLDAWLVHEETVVEDLKLVVEDAKRITLRHFVTFAFPAESLVVVRVTVSSDVDRLKYSQ